MSVLMVMLLGQRAITCMELFISTVEMITSETIPVLKVSLVAIQKGCTWSDHLRCKGKLLAVEHQNILLFLKGVLEV